VSREDLLRRVSQSITRVGRIGNSREAARIRAERSGVLVSRPGVAILAALHAGGPMRSSEAARRTDLEAPLVSRELQKLLKEGCVTRRTDDTDGRAGILELTPSGTRAFLAYRAATDEIVAETFAGWTSSDLHVLAELLERVADDFARVPETGARGDARKAPRAATTRAS